MKRRLMLAVPAALVGANLLGCATTGEAADPNDENLSVFLGFIDMSDAPSDVSWVSVKGYGANASNYLARVEDGLFFHIAVEPGSYQVDRFGGVSGLRGLFGRVHEYEWGTKGRNESSVRIDKPGVFFVGAHRYVPQKTGFFEQGKFEMVPSRSPTEREALQRLLRLMEGDPSLSVYKHQLRKVKQKLGVQR